MRSTHANSPPPLTSSNLHVSDSGLDTDYLRAPTVGSSDSILLPDHRLMNSGSTKLSAGLKPLLNSKLARAAPSLKTSSSDLLIGSGLHCRERTADSTQTAFRVEDATYHSADEHSHTDVDDSLKPPPAMRLRRSSSNSGIELRSRHHDPSIDSATLQQELMTRVKHPTQRPAGPWRTQKLPTLTGAYRWTNPRTPTPGFRWSPVRSNSDPSIPKVTSKAGKHGENVPLKSSLKRKSKSAATTPPSGNQTGCSTPSNGQKLRRVKTVDFDDKVSNKLSPMPVLKLWVTDAKGEGANEHDYCELQTRTARAKARKRLSRKSLCPGPASKARLADPAVTRTAVHVVAIAPSWSCDDMIDNGGFDPATPTMQIVESKNGCYEVIWDDIPAEEDTRSRRRSSSASEALQAVGTPAARGLERVNSKLTEWHWSGGPTQPFKPQIVVFPDDEAHNSQPSGCLEDDVDVHTIIAAPPNSARTSTNPSRQTSRPASSRASRAGSYDDNEATDFHVYSHAWDKGEPNFQTIPEIHAVSDHGVALGAPSEAIGNSKHPPTYRRLSNMEDTDIKFRGHRDSVTVARSRLFHAGGVSPELFMHKDSVTIAKKRMHAKNHTASGTQDMSHPRMAAVTESTSLHDDPSQILGLPSPPTVKKHATEALKAGSTASLLVPQQPVSERHIRILE